ncbi:hypothetical protein HEP74_02741 [Xanthomonas sp. SS]|nr:hypothetical protein HEP74_02741 [Xanthomonas sp. SS]
MRATTRRRAPTCARRSAEPAAAAFYNGHLFAPLACHPPRTVMSDPDPATADPCPQAPQPPLPSDCCNSGCPLCVHDLYNDEVARYRQALAAWRLRHPEADPGA